MILLKKSEKHILSFHFVEIKERSHTLAFLHARKICPQTCFIFMGHCMSSSPFLQW